MTKQQIIDAVLECAEKLGRTPSFIELSKVTGVSRKQVRWHFGDYRKAVKACGLERAGGGGGSRIELEPLFKDWARVVRALKKIPSTSEYVNAGKYSQTPLMTRFGVWANVPEGMKAFAQQKGWTEEWKDVMEMIDAQSSRRDRRGFTSVRFEKLDPTLSAKAAERMGQPRGPEEMGQGPDDAAKNGKGREVYGGLMRPYPLICAPVNEQGVIFLFGAKAEELGFAVLRIRAEYPDCLAFRQVEEGRLELVRIEFEFESKNFLKHMHEASQCDLIVCWRHNWPECPLEVVELSKNLTTD